MNSKTLNQSLFRIGEALGMGSIPRHLAGDLLNLNEAIQMRGIMLLAKDKALTRLAKKNLSLRRAIRIEKDKAANLSAENERLGKAFIAQNDLNLKLAKELDEALAPSADTEQLKARAESAEALCAEKDAVLLRFLTLHVNEPHIADAVKSALSKTPADMGAELKRLRASVANLAHADEKIAELQQFIKTQSQQLAERDAEVERLNQQSDYQKERISEETNKGLGYWEQVVALRARVAELETALRNLENVRALYEDAEARNERLVAAVAAGVNGVATHPDTLRLDHMLATIYNSGTDGLSDVYDWGIEHPLDRATIDKALSESRPPRRPASNTPGDDAITA